MHNSKNVEENMEKSTETIEAILEAYQQADDDATEILSYI
ncbi:hypothetical protein SanJ4211_1177c [Streptococcus anginosus]|nr:hypothetical protein SanJ4211_1177c [Streptococcus anginosus]